MLPPVSVVMCTYNGVKYLAQQWSSILDQDYPPLEIVVCDDGSTDGTWELLQSLAERTPFPVRLVQNKANLGFIRNFEKAIGLATGELLALADQDDVWEPEKLGIAAAAFQSDPGLLLFFSDALLVDEDGAGLGVTAWDCVGFAQEWEQLNAGGERQRLWRIHTVTGATVVMSRRLLGLALPFPPELDDRTYWHVHDGWLAAVAGTCGRVRAEPSRLVKYRRHTDQVFGLTEPVGSLTRGPRDEEFQYELWKTIALEERCLVLLSQGVLSRSNMDPSMRELFAFNRHLRERLEARTSPLPTRLVTVLRAFRAGSYDRSSGWRSAIVDITRR